MEPIDKNGIDADENIASAETIPRKKQWSNPDFFILDKYNIDAGVNIGVPEVSGGFFS